jgi:hypothetical protein
VNGDGRAVDIVVDIAERKVGRALTCSGAHPDLAKIPTIHVSDSSDIHMR